MEPHPRREWTQINYLALLNQVELSRVGIAHAQRQMPTEGNPPAALAPLQ
ncbi:hypothetical protein HW132_00830 [Brasilonema sp. CT11]|nr:hypothetical protein [Brasilonema sp. CT11]